MGTCMDLKDEWFGRLTAVTEEKASPSLCQSKLSVQQYLNQLCQYFIHLQFDILPALESCRTLPDNALLLFFNFYLSHRSLSAAAASVCAITKMQYPFPPASSPLPTPSVSPTLFPSISLPPLPPPCSHSLYICPSLSVCASIFQSLPLSPHLVYTFTSSVPPLPPLYPLSPLSSHVFHHHLSSSLSFTLVACFFQPFLTEKLREHTGLDRLWEGKARGTCEHHSQSRRMNNTSIVRSYFFKCMHTSKTCSKDVLSLSLSFTLSD